jgi:hypothetical protein
MGRVKGRNVALMSCHQEQADHDEADAQQLLQASTSPNQCQATKALTT